MASATAHCFEKSNTIWTIRVSFANGLVPSWRDIQVCGQNATVLMTFEVCEVAARSIVSLL